MPKYRSTNRLYDKERKGNKMNTTKRKVANFNFVCFKEKMEGLKIYINDYQTIKEFREKITHQEFLESFIDCGTYDVKKPWFVLSYDTYAQSMNDEEIVDYIEERLERMDFLKFIK